MNQIRAWVRQGRTDAWISHQLDISVDQLVRFKREHDLVEGEPSAGKAVDPLSIPVPEPSEFEDLSGGDEDDDDEQSSSSSRSRGSRGGRRRGGRGGRGRSAQRSDDEDGDDERPARRGSGSRGGGGRSSRTQRDGRGDRDGQRKQRASREKSDSDSDGDDKPKRRRGRRGGRKRSKIPSYEATFDHGGEGYGFWIDPSVVDNPVYGEHWAGHRAIVVRIDPDSITIRRAGADEPESED